jgi:hypothetical protein
VRTVGLSGAIIAFIAVLLLVEPNSANGCPLSGSMEYPAPTAHEATRSWTCVSTEVSSRHSNPQRRAPAVLDSTRWVRRPSARAQTR